MHFSSKRDRRTGVVNRASCFSFAVSGGGGGPLLGVHLLDANTQAEALRRPSRPPPAFQKEAAVPVGTNDAGINVNMDFFGILH
eukprot:g9187.t1